MNFKSALTSKELETVLTPHLRLFMSVDVVGSTALKHGQTTNEGEGNPWLNFVHGFFTGFPGILTTNIVSVKNKNGPETELPEPYLWKALGDELIFSITLSHPNQVRLYLKAFRLALNKARQSWAAGTNALPIDFKGTSWLAGFPVYNSAVPLATREELSSNSEHFDFVGPLIDIGFRLSKFASPRKFVISADIAWLVTKFGDTAGLSFYYDGREKLKGVLNDTPYPIFWVDCNERDFRPNTLEAVEDKLLGRDACKPADVLRLAERFLGLVKESIPKPFFHNLRGVSQHFKPPPGFKKRLMVAQSQLSRIYVGNESGRGRPACVEGGTVKNDEVEALLERVSRASASGKKLKQRKR